MPREFSETALVEVEGIQIPSASQTIVDGPHLMLAAAALLSVALASQLKSHVSPGKCHPVGSVQPEKSGNTLSFRQQSTLGAVFH